MIAMKKNILSVMLMLSACIIGCTEEYLEPDRMSFSLSSASIFDTGKGSSGSVEVKTTPATMWTLTPQEEQEWISFNLMEGKGPTTLDYTVEENFGLDLRSAGFIVKAYLYGELYQTDTITVEQCPQTPFVSIDSVSEEALKDISCYGEVLDLSILSNQNWTLSCTISSDNQAAPDWLTISQTSGAPGRVNVTVTAQLNPDEQHSRTALIIIKSEDGKIVVPVELRQSEFVRQEMTEMQFIIPGMTAYLPEGEGVLFMKDTKGQQTGQYDVTVSYNGEESAVIAFRSTVLSGNYLLEEFKDTGGNTYSVRRTTELIVLPETVQTIVEGWNNDFHTFSGASHEDPILLDIEGLKTLAEKVNSGNPYAGVYFALSGPVDLGGNWTAIGKYEKKPFSGCFDGKNYEISGMKITSQTQFNGLFGVVKGTAEHRVILENIIFAAHADGSYGIDMQNGVAFAGPVCAAAADYVTVRNCVNNMKLRLSIHSGGIVGTTGSTTVSQYNNLAVDGQYMEVLIENCHNRGDIEVVAGSEKSNWNTGGITGVNKGSVERCSNTGNITNSGIKYMHIGAVVGNNAGIVRECYNTGDMKGILTQAGGIVGIGAAGSTLIENCYNTGDILTNEQPAGGVIGTIPGNNAKGFLKMYNCYSTGAVGAKAGGVIGSLGQKPGYAIRFCASVNKPSFQGTNSFAKDDMKLEFKERLRQFTADYFTQKHTFTELMWDNSGVGTTKPTWDFNNVWDIDEGTSTPYLKNNEQIPHPVIE